MVKTLRVLHAPSDVAGLAAGLSAAFREIGVESTTLQFQSNYLNYESDVQLHLERYSLIRRYIRRLKFFVTNLLRFDCYHFYFGVSFLPGNLDMLILRLLGKRVFMTYQGSDIRLTSAHRKISGHEFKIRNEFANKRVPDVLKRFKCWYIALIAHKTYVVNPDLRLTSPSSIFLPYTNVDPRKWRPLSPLPRPVHKPLRVIHAPSNRRVKGTDIIIETVNRLRSENLPIDLCLAEGISHYKIIELAKDIDLAIDQLNIGWYGGFAVEMMSLGIPTICYLDNRISPLVPFYHDIPILPATRASLYFSLKDIILHPELLIPIQNQSREFVLHHHDPIMIAQKLLRDYQNVA